MSTTLDDVAGLLTERLDQSTLRAVLAQLLGYEPRVPANVRNIRAKQFREEILNCSKSQWYKLRAEGKIEPGLQISPGIEIWTIEQAMAIAAKLAEEQRQRRGEVMVTARARAATEDRNRPSDSAAAFVQQDPASMARGIGPECEALAEIGL